MAARLMAIVAEGDRARVYLAPTPEHEASANESKPDWKPENELIGKCRDQLPLYGMNSFGDIFTPRQLGSPHHLLRSRWRRRESAYLQADAVAAGQ